jgi:hypothetical protein
MTETRRGVESVRGQGQPRILATRVAALTDRMHDLELRFSALEARFGAFLAAIDARFGSFERRFAVQEERTSRMLSILVRLAERQGLPPESRPQ